MRADDDQTPTLFEHDDPYAQARTLARHILATLPAYEVSRDRQQLAVRAARRAATDVLAQIGAQTAPHPIRVLDRLQRALAACERHNLPRQHEPHLPGLEDGLLF